MQEMYDWYMDNLFDEHYKQAVKHAEKDARDRRKRIAKGGGGQKTVPVPGMTQDELVRLVARGFDRSSYSGRSKWERIGSPATATAVDWVLIVNPYTPPRMKWKAISRQYERYQEYSN